MEENTPLITRYIEILRRYLPDYHPSIVDTRIRQYLTQTGPEIGYAALDELENAFENKVPIRDSNRFVVGICRKVAERGPRKFPPRTAPSRYAPPGVTVSGYAPPPPPTAHGHALELSDTPADSSSSYTPGPPPADDSEAAPPILPPHLGYGKEDQEYAPEMPTSLDGVGLSPAVQSALEYCIQIKYCEVSDIDSKIVAVFQTLSDDAALRVLNEFVHSDRKTIRSPTGYIVGIMRKLGVDGNKLAPRRFYDSGRLPASSRAPPRTAHSASLGGPPGKRARVETPFGGGMVDLLNLGHRGGGPVTLSAKGLSSR